MAGQAGSMAGRAWVRELTTASAAGERRRGEEKGGGEEGKETRPHQGARARVRCGEGTAGGDGIGEGGVRPMRPSTTGGPGLIPLTGRKRKRWRRVLPAPICWGRRRLMAIRRLAAAVGVGTGAS